MDYSENIERFAKIAERYCTWADASESDAEADMKMARELLAELYVSVIGINDIGCGEELEHTVPVEDWKRILERFQKLPVDLYWSVFDPLEEEPPVLCSLADDHGRGRFDDHAGTGRARAQRSLRPHPVRTHAQQ